MNVIETNTIGILIALAGAAFNGFGQILEKKTINSLPRDAQLSKILYKKPVWVIGFCMENVMATITYMIAQLFIGPSLIPGLLAGSLIILSIGSVRILKERFKSSEILAIALLILGIVMLVFADVEINILNYDLLDTGFLIRSATLTVLLFSALVGCLMLQKRSSHARGIALAFISGFMFALSNLWISPLMGTIDRVFGEPFNWAVLTLFVISCIMLVVTNIIAMGSIQKSYQFGHAANLISIQQVPIQIVPIFLYFVIFAFLPLTAWSIPAASIAVALILTSCFLLAKRQESLEKITIISSDEGTRKEKEMVT